MTENRRSNTFWQHWPTTKSKLTLISWTCFSLSSSWRCRMAAASIPPLAGRHSETEACRWTKRSSKDWISTSVKLEALMPAAIEAASINGAARDSCLQTKNDKLMKMMVLIRTEKLISYVRYLLIPVVANETSVQPPSNTPLFFHTNRNNRFYRDLKGIQKSEIILENERERRFFFGYKRISTTPDMQQRGITEEYFAYVPQSSSWKRFSSRRLFWALRLQPSGLQMQPPTLHYVIMKTNPVIS